MRTPDYETVLDWHDERRAILQFDGGLSADDAKAHAWALTQKRYNLPDDYRLRIEADNLKCEKGPSA